MFEVEVAQTKSTGRAKKANVLCSNCSAVLLFGEFIVAANNCLVKPVRG